MLPDSDQHLENLYRLVNKQAGEKMRCEVARTAFLAGQYKAQQLRQQQLTTARKALKASNGLETAVTHSQAQDCLSPGTEPGNSQERNAQ